MEIRMPDTKAIRVLYIEDDAGLARLVQRRLEREGFSVDTSLNAGDGLSLYHRNRHDVLVVDQKLPDRSGLDVLRALADYRPAPISIMLTIGGDDKIAVEAMKLGADDYMVKDGNARYLDLLPNVIRQACERHRLAQAREEAERETAKAKQTWERTFDAVADSIIILDNDFRIKQANRATELLLGVPISELVGKRCYESFHSTGKPIADCPCVQLLADGHKHDALIRDIHGCDLLVSISPLSDAAGKHVGAVHVAHDVTESHRQERAVRDALSQKEVLLKEVHHRVKNNLQTIIALIGMESGHITDSQTVRMLDDLKARTGAMALVHETLYQSDDLSRINIGDYLSHLIRHLCSSSGSDPDVDVQVHTVDVPMEIDVAMPCGLIVTELVTNALKYAFPAKPRDNSKCRVLVSIEGEEHAFKLTVSDNGIGLPDNFDLHTSSSFGLRLLNILTSSSEYSLDVDGTNGAAFTVTYNQTEKPRSKHEA